MAKTSSLKCLSCRIPYQSLRAAPLQKLKSEKKNTQRNPTQRFFPPRPPSKFFVFASFLHFKEETQPEHKEFWRLKAPKKVNSGMGFLVKSLCLGVLFGLEKRGSEIFLSFFSAKGVVKLGVKFWWNFSCYVFQGLGVRGKISPKFHVKTVWKTENFTQISLCWGAALTKPSFTECLAVIQRKVASLHRFSASSFPKLCFNSWQKSSMIGRLNYF